MQEILKRIPGVDKLLIDSEIKKLSDNFGKEVVVYSIRNVLRKIRKNALHEIPIPATDEIVHQIINEVSAITEIPFKSVINATGIILHTNLGRAPFGEKLLAAVSPILRGYSNLEFDLQTGKRGHRNDLLRNLLKFVTGAENAAIVNNNAAAVMLCLKTFATGKEVIISRGELIEIGGSFRIPDIMITSGAKMVEVGTTNRTKLSDYENAITYETAVIFKAHKSNYYIGGFTEEVELRELSKLAKTHNLLLIYDLGSGLLRKPKNIPLLTEPDVKSSLEAGTDIVTFSGDKLLGGPQAGIIIGKHDLISKLEKAPLMRVLRVGKMTYAALSFVISSYLNDEKLFSEIPLFKMLHRHKNDLKMLAENLATAFSKYDISSEIVESPSYCGGGTLPHLKIKSYAVRLLPNDEKDFAEKMFFALLNLETPILAILREGNLLFDVMTLFAEDISKIAASVNSILKNEKE